MTLLEIDKKYTEALVKGVAFSGHPVQTEAAALLYNNWPSLRAAITEQANTIRLQEERIQRLLASLPKHGVSS